MAEEAQPVVGLLGQPEETETEERPDLSQFRGFISEPKARPVTGPEDVPEGAGELAQFRNFFEEQPIKDAPIEADPAFISSGAAQLAHQQEVASSVAKQYNEAYDPDLDMTPEGSEWWRVPGDVDEGIQIHDVGNFLFGDEMAILGIKMDQNGFQHDWKYAQQQWSEQPMWINLLSTASLIGFPFLPAIKGLQATTKFGRLGLAMGKWDKATELAKFKQLGAISDDVAEMSTKDLIKLRQLEHSRSKYIQRFERMEKAKKGEADLSVVERGQAWFDDHFANQYMKKIRSVIYSGKVDKEYADSLHKFWRTEDLGRFFENLPGEERGLAIYAHYLKRNKPDLDLDSIAKQVDPDFNLGTLTLSAEEAEWADRLYDTMKLHQQQALDEAMILPETVERIGEIHLARFTKGTPQIEAKATATHFIPIRDRVRKHAARQQGEESYIALRSFEFPRLDAPQMKHRLNEYPEIAQRLFEGKLITDPADLTIRNYVMDRMLMNNYMFVRDLVKEQGRRVDDLIAKYGTLDRARKAGWVDLSSLQGEVAPTLRRMLKAKGYRLADNEPLPFIHEHVFDELFGKSGLFSQTQSAVDFMSALVAVHKTSKTAASIPTHIQNKLGNDAMLIQRGMNPYSKENLNATQKLARVFSDWADATKAARGKGLTLRDLMDPKTGKIKGVNFGKMKINGREFDLNDELLDPMVRDLIEESAFQQAEGFGVLQSMAERVQKGTVTESFIKGALKLAHLGGPKSPVTKTFDTMTKWYLGEDMIPKMLYYMNLRGKGLTKEWAAIEVGRSLPMYGTVGVSVQRARRHMFPWATFPTEAMRIFKNNITDHPMRMIPWLQLPNVTQTGLSLMGAGPDFKEIEQRKRGGALWTQTPTTVVTEGESGMRTAGGISGAAVGSFLGSYMGGAKGAVLGTLGGAAAGAALPSLDEIINEESDISESIRAAVLNWLPHSSFLPKYNSPDWHFDSIPSVIQQMPAEPLAMYRPIIDIISGQDGFGRELGGEDLADKLGKVVSGYIGFMSPPLFQKYGLKTTTPDISVSEAVSGGLLGEPTHVPGDITNVSRLLKDTGMEVDAMSGKPGSFGLDTVVNNFGGIWRSYPINPEVQLINEGKTEKALQATRGYLTRNLTHHVVNGNDAQISNILLKIFHTFTRQYQKDPAMAQNKFAEWMTRRIKQFGRHPMMRNWSEDELLARFQQASDFAAQQRTQASKDIMKVISQELAVRKMNKR